MKRRLVGTMLFCTLLTCIMGADEISFDENQPVANPGGKANTIEGKGTYKVDPANQGPYITMTAELVGQSQLTLKPANLNDPNWETTLTVAPGTYDCWGTLLSVKKMGGGLNYTYTYTYKGDPTKKARLTVK